MKKTLSSIIAGILAIAAAAQGWSGEGCTVRTASQKMVRQLDGKGGRLHSSVWGILAVNMKGDTLAALNPCRLMVPASNMKLITTAGALLRLGGGYTFDTAFGTDGEIADSTLNGNLYIIGGGDPTLGSIFSYLPSGDYSFRRWKKVLQDKGIKRINGDIVGDGRHFRAERVHTDWSTEDIECKDGVVPSGLTWRGAPSDSLPDGPLAAAWHFREWLLRDSCISISGTAREVLPEQDSADSLAMLGKVQSPTLRAIISMANRWSDNFMAETLIKELGMQLDSNDSYSSSIACLRRSLAPIGMARRSSEQRFADGSGLSRKNYLSPDFIVGVLRGMATSRQYGIFRNSLPIPGSADGTLRARLSMADAATRGRIRMKSGSMNGNRCFSGYILSPDGDERKTIAFSVMVNNFVGRDRDLADCLDGLIASLAEENK